MSFMKFIYEVHRQNKEFHAAGCPPMGFDRMMEIARQDCGLTVVNEAVLNAWNHRDRLDGLHVQTCIMCGVRFGVDAEYYLRSLVNHMGGCSMPDENESQRGWYCCPNGCRVRAGANAIEVLSDRAVEAYRKMEMLEAKLEAKSEGGV